MLGEALGLDLADLRQSSVGVCHAGVWSGVDGAEDRCGTYYEGAVSLRGLVPAKQ